MTDPNLPAKLSLAGGDATPRWKSTADGLSDDMLAAYIDGRLAAADRRAVDAIIAADPEAYAWLSEAVALARELPDDPVAETPVPRHAPIRRRWWPLAVAGLATAAALAVVVRGTVTPSPSPERILAGLAADTGTPAFDPWLSGGFGVAAQSAMRGGGDGRPSSAVLARVVELESAAARTPSPAAVHALGVALLVAGGEGRAGALAHLEAAAAAEPGPAYLSDAGAAYLERAIRTGAAADAELALERTNRALVIAPALPEALYNRALALQTLNRSRDAIEAWTAFLRTPAGPAHGAAREHLARLRGRVAPGTTP
jgi:tetratricopeptide (TPR) repeat protein